MSEIAKVAGMTMPGLTHHFATKAILLEAVLNDRDIDAATHLDGRSGIDLMRGLVEIAARDESDIELTQLFTILSAEATSPEHPAHSYFAERYLLILNNVERAFDEARKAGHMREGVNPTDAARMYVALADGLPLQRLYEVGAPSQADVLNVFFGSILAPSAQWNPR